MHYSKVSSINDMHEMNVMTIIKSYLLLELFKETGEEVIPGDMLGNNTE